MKDDKNKLKDYAKYSAVAFQMAAVIFIGAFGGVKIDEMWQTKPIFTLILTLMGVAAALYLSVKDFLKK